MIGLFTLLLGLVTLYLLSQKFIQKLYEFLYHLTRSHKRSGYFLALIFLPGTFIHEISHFLAALFLLVPVGKLNLVPEVYESGVRMGSVQIAKTDLVRASVIGVAPFLVGTTVILGSISYAISSGLINNPYFVAFMLYLVFQITHTMFSSKTDLKAVIELAVILIIVLMLMLVFNVIEPFNYAAEVIEKNRIMIEQLSLYIFIPIGLESLLILLLSKIR
jgi:hypothetical protein